MAASLSLLARVAVGAAPAILLAWWPFGRRRAGDTPDPEASVASPPASALPSTNDGSPRISFDGIKRIQRYRNRDGGDRVFEDVQIWLANRPDRAESGGILRRVRATLEFRQDGVAVLPPGSGQWAISSFEDTTARVSMYDVVDLAPDGPVARLLIAYKWPGDKAVYTYAPDNVDHPGARVRDRALAPGDYDLTVTLTSDDLEDTFTFRFTNPGASGHPTIAGPLRISHVSKRSPAAGV